jgi:hypothetical protein
VSPVGPAVALETSREAAQWLLAWAASGTASVIRYRDLACFDDPEDPTLRDRRSGPVLRGLVALLRSEGAAALAVAPRREDGRRVRRLARAVARELPELIVVTITPARLATPLPPPDVDAALPWLTLAGWRADPRTQTAALRDWAAARRAWLLARRGASGSAPCPALDPDGTLVLRVAAPAEVGLPALDGVELYRESPAPMAENLNPGVAPEPAPGRDCPNPGVAGAPAPLAENLNPGVVRRALRRLASGFLRPGGLDAALALVHEALGDRDAARRLLVAACRARGCAGRPVYELVRLHLDPPDVARRSALRALERLPDVAIDPAWVALQVALRAAQEGRPRDARLVAEAALRALLPSALCGSGPPPSAGLDLLRALVWACSLLGDRAAARAINARVLLHPQGRSARDRANQAALAVAPCVGTLAVAPCAGAAAGVAAAAAPGPSPSPAPSPSPSVAPPSPAPRLPLGASRPDVTLVSLARDDEAGHRVAPAGCLALVAALRAAGRSAAIVDRQLAAPERFADLAELCRSVGDPGPVIGLSAMADRLPLLALAAGALRAVFPDRLIVAGGPGPSSVAPALLRAAPALDVVVVGEGEATLVELVERFERGGHAAAPGCPGTVARRPDDAAIVPGPPRGRLLDLDRLPLPAYDALPLSDYDDVTVVTARGCPYGCVFCDASALWGRRRAERSVPHVLAELRLLHETFGRPHVHLEDDTLLLPRARVEALCTALREQLPRLTWGCLGRADALDESLVETLARAGCRSLFLGLESASDAVLARIAKGTDAARGTRAALLAARSLAVRAYYIWGFPFESWREFVETFAAAALLRAEGLDVGHSLLAPFPTTPLWREFGARARLLPADPELPRLFQPPPSNTAEGALVAAHPAAFPFFSTYETPAWAAKRDFVARWRRGDVRPVTPPPG